MEQIINLDEYEEEENEECEFCCIEYTMESFYQKLEKELTAKFIKKEEKR